jgi:hypothetical protein
MNHLLEMLAELHQTEVAAPKQPRLRTPGSNLARVLESWELGSRF